jgi:hypothetical protein
MAMTYLQQVAGFCRIMELLACVWAEILPTEQSKRKGVAGCVHQYCYCRERKYCPFEDVNDFGYVIQVKDNAPELLRRALSRVPVDMGALPSQSAVASAKVGMYSQSPCAVVGGPACADVNSADRSMTIVS